MYLNEFSDSTESLDMTRFDEFRSLLASATDLGIPHSPDVRYVSRNVVVRHQRFHLLEWGDPEAPPVLLLHGGNQSAHSWDLVSLHLADRFRVVALDQRGHGDSEWARDSDYSSQAMAGDAEATIAVLGLERPIVFGHSMGGRNTLRLALDHRDLARAFVIVDIGPEVAAEGARAIGQFVNHNREFDDLEDFVSNVQRYDPFRSREHIERTVKYNLMQRADGKFVSKCDYGRHMASMGESRAQLDPISLDDVKVLEQPVLVVRGANSNILSEEAAKRFAAALPDGRLVTVPESGHNVHGQNTPGFLDAVRPFLDAL